MGEFAKECSEKNINFIGICCGAEAHHVREMSMSIGKKPISMKYVTDMNVNQDRELRLGNIIAQERAKWLLTKTDEYFFE